MGEYNWPAAVAMVDDVVSIFLCSEKATQVVLLALSIICINDFIDSSGADVCLIHDFDIFISRFFTPRYKNDSDV